MKLFLIVYSMGQLAAYQPADNLAGCHVDAATMNAAVITVIQNGRGYHGEEITPAEMKKLRTMRAACEYRKETPNVGEREI